MQYPTTSYPSNWRKGSGLIRSLANGRCEWCGRPTVNLSVHHIGIPYPDGRPSNPSDKHDLRRENLVAICFECHDAVDFIRKVHASKKLQRAKRRARLEAHRALGIGTGLVLKQEIAA